MHRRRYCAVRFGLLLLVAVLMGSMARRAAAQTEVPVRTRPLSSMLVELAAQSPIDLLYHPDLVRGKWAPAVLPEGTVASRLAYLLKGSGISYVRLPSGTYVLVPHNAAPEDHDPAALAGQVVDRESGYPLAGVHVSVDGLRRGRVTDAQGRYVFDRMEPGRHTVRVSHVGFAARLDTVDVASHGPTTWQVALTPQVIPIPSLIVEEHPSRIRAEALHVVPLTNRLPLSSAWGTADAVRTLGRVSGVQVEAGAATLHLQGGGAGEHQFRIDGMPVFEPVHLRGLFGAFNPYALQKVEVHKAGYGAEYGSQLSGVIEARHALPRQAGMTLSAQIDPLALNGRWEGATRDDRPWRLRYMVAARSTLGPMPAYLDSLLQAWNAPDTFLPRASLWSLREADPVLGGAFLDFVDAFDPHPAGEPYLSFTDANGAVQVQFNPSHRLYASFYQSRNHLGGARLQQAMADTLGTLVDLGQDTYRWRNNAAQMTYTVVFRPSTFGRFSVRSSRYQLAHSYDAPDNDKTLRVLTPDLRVRTLRYDVAPADDGNFIREVGFDGTLSHLYASGHQIQLGGEFVRTTHHFGIDDVYYTPISSMGESWRISSFTEGRFRIGAGITATVGGRWTYLPEHHDFYGEPRADVRYGSRSWSLRAAAGVYRQFVNQFDMSSVSPSALLPSIRFWLPIDASVKPPRARHFAFEIQRVLSARWTARLEAFDKRQTSILQVDYAALWHRLEDQEVSRDQSQYLTTGHGRAYGGALQLERVGTMVNARLQYDYVRARQTFSFLPPDTMVAVPWNEPHKVLGEVTVKPITGLTVTGRVQSSWGRSWGFRRAYYDYLTSDPQGTSRFGDVDFRSPTDHVLPAFQQMDLRVAYSRKIGPATVHASIEVLNVTDHDNVADWSLIASRDRYGYVQYDRAARSLIARTFVFSLGTQW